MNQYIITEEQLKKYEGLGHSELLYEIRSHPYQSERDKVLETMFAESPRTEDMLTILKKRYRDEMAILDYIEMIECEVMALRQAGEP